MLDGTKPLRHVTAVATFGKIAAIFRHSFVDDFPLPVKVRDSRASNFSSVDLGFHIPFVEFEVPRPGSDVGIVLGQPSRLLKRFGPKDR
jgi:hypothetical protein